MDNKDWHSRFETQCLESVTLLHIHVKLWGILEKINIFLRVLKIGSKSRRADSGCSKDCITLQVRSRAFQRAVTGVGSYDGSSSSACALMWLVFFLSLCVFTSSVSLCLSLRYFPTIVSVPGWHSVQNRVTLDLGSEVPFMKVAPQTTCGFPFSLLISAGIIPSGGFGCWIKRQGKEST